MIGLHQDHVVAFSGDAEGEVRSYRGYPLFRLGARDDVRPGMARVGGPQDGRPELLEGELGDHWIRPAPILLGRGEWTVADEPGGEGAGRGLAERSFGLLEPADGVVELLADEREQQAEQQ